MKKFTLILLVAGTVLILLIQYGKNFSEHPPLTVTFLDVGQGDSVYIRAPNGNDVLIDGGPDDAVIRKLREVMPPFDNDLDLVVGTHPDKDHIAGLSFVFDEFQVKNFLHSEIRADTSFDRMLADRAEREPDLRTITARRGERFILDRKRGVFIDILFPDQDTTNFKETNEASIVARLVYGQQSFLLTGDSPASVEYYLATTDKKSISSTVLKLGHHGSKTSSNQTFLETVAPSVAVVSAGKNNTYHHPSPEVVSRVHALNIPIVSTIEQGTLVFETDGITLHRR
jgi:competence protein ComEC